MLQMNTKKLMQVMLGKYKHTSKSTSYFCKEYKYTLYKSTFLFLGEPSFSDALPYSNEGTGEAYY